MFLKMPFIPLWGQSVYDDKILADIQEGYALIFPICLCNKDVFAEDILHKS